MALLGVEALPARSTATTVAVLVPVTSAYVIVSTYDKTSLMTPLIRNSYSTAPVGSSSVTAVHRAQISSGQDPPPTAAAASRIGLEGAVTSALAAETFPDSSTDCTAIE